MKKRHAILSIVLTLAIVVGTMSCMTFTVSAEGSSPLVNEFGHVDNVEGGNILHCWCWSFNNIKENMKKISDAGYSAVQTSPINEIYRGDNGGMQIFGEGKWYYQYQPTNYTIGNYQLGTEDEFKAMCQTAHSYGVKVIVDIVANHTTPTKSAVSSTLKNIEGGLYHTNNGSTDTRYKMTQTYPVFPDINTQNPNYQNLILEYLKTCVADGADGFRFDNAKNIELPDDDPSYASDFWPTVLNNGSIYQYGEILQSQTNKESDRFDAYADYLHVTASIYGYTLRNYFYQGCARDMASSFLSYSSSGVSSDRLVTWVETHDTYVNEEPVNPNSSFWMTNEEIRRGWALVASRKGTTSLFFSRPYGSQASEETDSNESPRWGTNHIGDAGDDNYFHPEVVAVNKFRTAMLGESDKLENIIVNGKKNNKLIMLTRGTRGAVLINNSTDDVVLEQATNLVDGTYTDAAHGGQFIAYGGKLFGTVKAGEVSVIYDDASIYSSNVPEEYTTAPTEPVTEPSATTVINSSELSTTVPKKDGVTRPVVTDVVNSLPEVQVPTRRYYFYMPDTWYNDRNINYDAAIGIDSVAAGIYWYTGSYNCKDFMGESTRDWPGHLVLQHLTDYPSIWFADVPEDATSIVWNNMVYDNNGENDGFEFQTTDIKTQYLNVEDDPYALYKNGLESMDGMIFVCNSNDKQTNPLSQVVTQKGEWFYYYGNGEYGTTPQKEASNFSSLKEMGFPKIEKRSNSIQPTQQTIVTNPTQPTMATQPTVPTTQAKTSIVATINNNNIYVGEQERISISIYNGVGNIMFYSTDNSVATVSSIGIVQGVGEGTAQIIVENNGSTASILINVIDAPPELNSDVIYFDAAGWKNFSKVYCHMWVISHDSFFDWQSPDEKCTKVSGTMYSYDLSKLSGSTDVLGGLKSGGMYGVVFSTDTGLRTYDLTIGPECKGDTVSLTGSEIENPVDSNKKDYEAVWESNSDEYGPHKALSSIGNVIGSKLAPSETGIHVIGDWVCTYCYSPNVDAVDVLAKAMPKFGIKSEYDIEDIYAYCTKKDGVPMSYLPVIKKTLEDAFGKAYPSTTEPTHTPITSSYDISNWNVFGLVNKTYTGKAITQKIVVTNGVNVATSKVIYTNNKNAGTATMVISGTGDYTGIIVKTFKINKASNKMTAKASAKTVKYATVKKKAATVSALTVKSAQGAVSYKKASGNAKITVNAKTGKLTVKKGTKKGTYSIKVKVTAKGNSNYNSATKTVTVKIKVK